MSPAPGGVKPWDLGGPEDRSLRSFAVSDLKCLMPIGSMYGIYANIGGIWMVNVTIYSIHGSYGMRSRFVWVCLGRIVWACFSWYGWLVKNSSMIVYVYFLRYVCCFKPMATTPHILSWRVPWLIAPERNFRYFDWRLDTGGCVWRCGIISWLDSWILEFHQ